jgi:uncharacterized membrane protein
MIEREMICFLRITTVQLQVGKKKKKPKKKKNHHATNLKNKLFFE